MTAKAASPGPMAGDPFNLARFVVAQADVFDQAIVELRRGRKRTHWMWFVFPQLQGLGRSPAAWHFGIRSLEEASAYVMHPVLGPRLEIAVAAALAGAAADAQSVFGSPDDVKFRSSMTLFGIAAPDGPYRRALDRLCEGEPDPRTLDLLRLGGGGR